VLYPLSYEGIGTRAYVQAEGVEPPGLLLYGQRLTPPERLLGVTARDRQRGRDSNPQRVLGESQATLPIRPPRQGVPTWIRTGGLRRVEAVLCRLSYLPEEVVRREGLEPSTRRVRAGCLCR
jgi:hypothetical protein